MIRPNRSKLIWTALAATLIGLIAYGLYPENVPVELVRPTRGVLEITIDDDGETRIREKYIVSTPVSGNMLRLQLHAGDCVKQDQTELAQIKPCDPSLLDARAHAEALARVRAAEAAVEQADALMDRSLESLELAGHHYDRAKELLKRAAASQADFDQAEHQQRIAKAEVRSAEFARSVAKHELEQSKAALVFTSDEATTESPGMFQIHAPINGNILNVFHEDASFINAGTPLIELGDPQDMEIKIDVLSTDAVRIRPGNRVYIEHWGGEEVLQGTVRLVEPAAFLKISALGVEEKRVNVIVDFDDPWEQRQSLGDGFRVEARIVAQATSSDTLKVPAGVLFRRGDSWRAFRVIDGVADEVLVKPGRSNGLETEVLSGISEDDELILHPTDSVENGTRVNQQA
jgi:HlyD family secretion protein